MPDTGTKRSRGVPRGRQKGYTRSNRNREEMLKKKPAATLLKGIVGKVPNLYLLIDSRLEKMDWNWSRFASEIPCSRQYLIDCTDKAEIPHMTFLRICQVLELKPKDLIQSIDEDDE